MDHVEILEKPSKGSSYSATDLAYVKSLNKSMTNYTMILFSFLYCVYVFFLSLIILGRSASI